MILVEAPSGLVPNCGPTTPVYITTLICEHCIRVCSIGNHNPLEGVCLCRIRSEENSNRNNNKKIMPGSGIFLSAIFSLSSSTTCHCTQCSIQDVSQSHFFFCYLYQCLVTYFFDQALELLLFFLHCTAQVWCGYYSRVAFMSLESP